MVGQLRQMMDPNQQVRLKTAFSGRRNRWRYTAYDADTGAYALSGPVWGFPTLQEAIDHGHLYMNVVDD